MHNRRFLRCLLRHSQRLHGYLNRPGGINLIAFRINEGNIHCLYADNFLIVFFYCFTDRINNIFLPDCLQMHFRFIRERTFFIEHGYLYPVRRTGKGKHFRFAVQLRVFRQYGVSNDQRIMKFTGGFLYRIIHVAFDDRQLILVFCFIMRNTCYDCGVVCLAVFIRVRKYEVSPCRGVTVCRTEQFYFR